MSIDNTLEQLVDITTKTNLVALDRTLSAINFSGSKHYSYMISALEVSNISSKIIRAAYEVRMAAKIK